MDCDFCISADIDDYLEDYLCRIETALIDGTCYECNCPIAAGDECEVVSGMGEDGEFGCVTCLDCADVAKAFCCNGRMHGSLWSDLESSIDAGAKITTGCLSKLTRANAKAKVRDLWNEMTLGAGRDERG